MPATRLMVAASSLAFLVSCASDMTRARKPITYQGRVLTGATEYYRLGYRAPSVSELTQPRKKKSWLSRDSSNALAYGEAADVPRKGWIFGSTAATTTSGRATHGTIFANPDGTTSRIEYGAMVRSDGRKDWIIGNTVFHANGTRSRIVGDTLIGPDGARSRKVQ